MAVWLLWRCLRIAQIQVVRALSWNVGDLFSSAHSSSSEAGISNFVSLTSCLARPITSLCSALYNRAAFSFVAFRRYWSSNDLLCPCYQSGDLSFTPGSAGDSPGRGGQMTSTESVGTSHRDNNYSFHRGFA